MTFHFSEIPLLMARCAKCGGDLAVKKKPNKNQHGKVFCTEKGCVFFNKAHPTGSMPNEGKAT